MIGRVLLILVAGFTLHVGAAAAEARLTLGIVLPGGPALDSEEQFARFVAGLGEEIGREIDPRVFADQAGLVAWFRRYRMLDLALLPVAEGRDPLVGEYVPLGLVASSPNAPGGAALQLVGRSDLPEADRRLLQLALAPGRLPAPAARSAAAMSPGSAEPPRPLPAAASPPLPPAVPPGPSFQVVARSGVAVAPLSSAGAAGPVDLTVPPAPAALFEPSVSSAAREPQPFGPWSRPAASPPLPLHSPLYPALDKLAAMGWIDGGLHGTRPYTRSEAARMTAEAIQRLGTPLPRHAMARELVAELRGELAEELTHYGLGAADLAGSYLRPMREVELRQLFRDGPDSSFAAPGIVAGQFALDVNQNGKPLGDDGRLELTVAGEARVGRSLLFYWRPQLLNEQGGDGSETELRLEDGALSLDLGPVTLSAGRQALWWGPGRRGSLILTNNAEPLDMVRITNPTPVLLPGFLQALGPLRFDFFVSRLEDDRAVPEPYFGGFRLDLKPLPWLELGLSRTALVGGDGRSDPEWSDLLTLIGGENLSSNDDSSNSLGSLDLRLRLPLLSGLELYGELGSEDDDGGFSSELGYLGGLYLPAIGPEGRYSLRYEYVDLSGQEQNFLGWYRHAVYQSGYTYRGVIPGHPAGSLSREHAVEMDARIDAAWRVTLGFARQERGIGRAVQEEHLQGWSEVAWRFHRAWLATLGYAQDEIDNADYSAGRDATGRLVTLSLSGHF